MSGIKNKWEGSDSMFRGKVQAAGLGDRLRSRVRLNRLNAEQDHKIMDGVRFWSDVGEVRQAEGHRSRVRVTGRSVSMRSRKSRDQTSLGEYESLRGETTNKCNTEQNYKCEKNAQCSPGVTDELSQKANTTNITQ